MADLNGLLSNPWINIGMGILSANRPGASAGQAVGGGYMLASENLRRMQQVEAAKQRQKMIEEQAKREDEERRRQAAYIEELSRKNPEVGALLSAFPGAAPNLLTKMYSPGGFGIKTLKEGDKFVNYQVNPESGQWEPISDAPRWQPKSSGGGYGTMVLPDGRVISGSAGLLGQFPLGVPQDKVEARQMRKKARSLDDLAGDAARLETFILNNPGSAGGLQKAKAYAGSWLEQTGDFFNSGWARNAGASLSENHAIYKARAQTFVNSSKAIFMADEGRLSNEDRARLERAAGAIENATTDRQVLLVVREVQGLVAERRARLGVGGAQPSPGAGEAIGPSEADLIRQAEEYLKNNPGQ